MGTAQELPDPRGNVIKLLAQADGYCMVRREGYAPHVIALAPWKKMPGGTGHLNADPGAASSQRRC